jgi:S1 RNA binding domain protein
MSTIEVGAKREGKVTGITTFGAFVELSPGVTGLVHISEIADSYVKDVNDHLKVDDVVTVKVLHVEPSGKIGLSIKKAIDKPPVPEGRLAYETRRDSVRERGGGRGGDRRNAFAPSHRLTFEDKMSRFLKDSEERMISLKKNTEGKRGGRGARRV